MPPLNILVAIANHGEKNRIHCEHLIATYRAMAHNIDIVVLSDKPKSYGPGIEVLVGAPSDDPWSLPFAHRPLFVDRKDDYDLFIYTEDDTEVLDHHVALFLEATEHLPSDRILGFLRYETDGERFNYSTAHHVYHWVPESVIEAGGRTYARYTNDHAGMYLLTREQLAHCIRSGGFAIEPHATKFDMLVSAATDPYTSCGLDKLVCVSELFPSALHHLPDVYLDRIGVARSEFEAQAGRLLELHNEGGAAHRLFDPTAKVRSRDATWDKKYYEPARPEVVDVITESNVSSVLSVGCERGATERLLVEQGLAVTAIPLDAVIAAAAEVNGMEVMSPSIDGARRELDGREFDVILFNDTLAHFADPVKTLLQTAVLLAEGGHVVASFKNLQSLSFRKGRLRSETGRIRSAGFAETGLHWTDGPTVSDWFRQAGLQSLGTHYPAPSHRSWLDRSPSDFVKSLLCPTGIVVGTS